MQNTKEHSPVAASAATRGTRLVVRDIDVENFKSYAGKHRIGPFHKTFTAVIGPNGSGKSNVIDSMLFVFGKNARKIRLEKLSELIHVSAAHQNLTYASVTVNFVRVRESLEEQRDPNFRMEEPNSELSIKREVHKSGLSQYFINGVRTAQREVVETLIKQGVDLEHNRFLILQGEVEQIALMKPKAEREGEEGLLEYLDDLIGTNSFAGKISEATKAAEEAQVARLDALDRERKLRAEREALDDAKNSAIAFVTKDNHLQKILITLCQLRMRTLEEKLTEPRRLLKEIDDRIVEMRKDVDEKLARKLHAEEKLSLCKRELAEVTKERDAARAERDAADKKVEQLRSGADEDNKARRKLEDRIKKVKGEMEKALLQQQDTEREAIIHQQNLEEATQYVEQLQKEYDSRSEELVSLFTPLRQELDKKKAAFAPYERAVVEMRELLDTARSRLEAQQEVELKLKEQLDKLDANMDTHKERAMQLEHLLKDADNERYKEELQRLQDTLTGAAERKHSINSAIQEIKSSYREGEADDRAMEFLLSQRSLKGYYGTLRQLGRIDDAYDIAAGVASNAWTFHVVEDRKTASKALELLRVNNVARASMLVLQEVERELKSRMESEFRPPTPKAKRLFDLITPINDRFRVAFYHAVGNTLVVRDLSEAREVAFGGAQRHRVVTLRGELAEPGGSITGGGSVPRGAKLKAARLPQDKEAAKAELQRLQAELVEAVEEERVAQEQLNKLRLSQQHLSPEQVSRLRVELRSLRVTLESSSQQRAQLLEEMEENEVSNKKRRVALADKVQEAQQNLHVAEKSRDSHQSDVKRLEEELENVGGEGYKLLGQELKKQQGRAEAEENALRECRRLSQRLRATRERKETDMAEYVAELQRITEEAERGAAGALPAAIAATEELTRLYNAVDARYAKAQSVIEEAKAAVPEMHKALVEAQKKLGDEERFRQVETAKMADALQELEKFEQKIDGCEEKIKENVELYGWETLELTAPEAVADGQTQAEENKKQVASTAGSDDEVVEEPSGREDVDVEEDVESVSTQVTERGQVQTADIQSMSFRLSPEELSRCDYERSVHLAKSLSEETKLLHGEIDFRAVALWRERDAEYRKGRAQYLSLKEVSDAADRQLQQLKEERRHSFMECFVRVQERLREVYQLLTHGGDADLELVDVNDPFEGINFVVRPPKKSWKQISNLSGGEKTLSSLALIFSLHDIKPTPIYVMDEIDAALDFRNVSIVANYILRQASGAQFIIISLRNNMFELAHQLVGVCKVMDVARTLVLVPSGFQRKVLAALQQRFRKRAPPTRGEDDDQEPSDTRADVCKKEGDNDFNGCGTVEQRPSLDFNAESGHQAVPLSNQLASELEETNSVCTARTTSTRTSTNRRKKVKGEPRGVARVKKERLE
ncbi:RecF RecN SMC N terminal domain [Trypanosoma vivax]|uniref:Structural maintenance of chromosomes protein n=1 Tax=Trypanosoma vivax (strain Y486) TaxID=1055687 RepID=G0U571_TRYVY|nr:structural maintenance of chromosome [Trypanosoma vivax]KAH8616556.1 RecF RecN SMC N terminal domain [Trypanosoma vivax]CCC51019.1 structural maintenance of chromosome [Trypanosoma vivax Y486]